MSIHSARRATLALTTLAAIGCSPDRPTAPSGQPLHPGGPTTNIEKLPTTAPILYDQSSVEDTVTGFGGGFFGSGSHGDDFVVPAGQAWTVTQVVFSGSLVIPTLPFAIRANDTGVPGAVLRSFSLARWRATRTHAVARREIASSGTSSSRSRRR